MYVCLCRSVTDKDIKRAVDAGHRDPVAVRDHLGVGTGCGRCREFAAVLVHRLVNDLQPRFHAA